jgi:hypothetical protein
MRLARIRIVIVVVAALAAAIFGITRLIGALGAEAQASPTGSLDSLNVAVSNAGWLDMEHDMSTNAPGYQMPPAMMPGMPEQGKERLAITLTVMNTSDGSRPFRPAREFALHAGKGELITPHSDTFGEVAPRLAGHNAVTGTLFFDLPTGEVDDSATWLEWSHGGASARVSVPMNGAGSGPIHQHNP